jgi:hypothetical protein
MNPENTHISDSLNRARDAFMTWHEIKSNEFADKDQKENAAVEAVLALSDVLSKSTASRFGDLLSQQEFNAVHQSMILIRQTESQEVFARSVAEAASKFLYRFTDPNSNEGQDEQSL